MFFAAAYLVLAAVFVTTHFTRLENSETVVGGMSVKVRSSLGSRLIPPKIRRMSLAINGMEMLFRRRSRAVIVTEDGIRHALEVVSWEAGEDSLHVNLSSGAAVNFEVNPREGELRIVPEIPATVPPVRSMELPLRAHGEAVIAGNADQPRILRISSEEGDYIAYLPADSSWYAESGKLDLSIQAEAAPVLEVSVDTRIEPLNARQWFKKGTVPSVAVYTNEIKRWAVSARRGWPARLSKVGVDSPWSDTLAAAVLSDAAPRGSLAGSLKRVTAAAGRTPGRIGWLPSPYLGNIVNQFQGRLSELDRTAAQLRSGISRGNPDFSVDSALTVMVDMRYRSDAEAMVRAAGNMAKTPGSRGNALARLRILQEARGLDIGSQAENRSARERLINEYLLPSVYWINEGLILMDAQGAADVNLSMTAGTLMVKEGQLTGSALYGAVGRQMVISGLRYADADGLLPASLDFESEGEPRREGTSASESVYSLIMDSGAYPRHLSLAGELGAGAWAITAAGNFSVRDTGDETVITMDFPAGSSHHTAVRGIRNFKTLIMRGMEWNPDPAFQQYHSGWSYDATGQTLYIKIRHRTRRETVRILHTQAAAAAAQPQTPAAEAEASQENTEAPPGEQEDPG